MKYMGSKAKHAKDILPLILKNRRDGQFYVEPFMGGANVIDKVSGNRIGNDYHRSLVAFLEALSNGWVPPSDVSESEYNDARTLPDDDPLKAFIAFLCSFGGKWFGGYARGFANNGTPRNYAAESYRNVMKQASNLKGIDFRCGSYLDLDIPPRSIIYCDPPYAGTTKYSTGDFDHNRFWKWCDAKHNEGHTVFVSEYAAPHHWKCVWQKDVSANFDSNREKGAARVEKLFTRNRDDLFA